MSYNRSRLSLLIAGVAPIGLMAALASPALAQETAPQDSTTSPQDEQAPTDTTADTGDEVTQDIVVTGTLFRRADTETVSPVTTVTAENLDQRGISTTQEAIQTLAANNGPALTNSFSANGAFAGGASAVSLRGLSTNSTLVLFDGLRAAYYPLADDGTRNFVDLNTIPDDIIQEIQVLRDGASSSYGADAIAGVVNIITKREVQGVSGRVEGGISSRGDAAQYRLSLTGGQGDIEEDGYNAYLSGFYYKSDLLRNHERPYPYNSDDLRNVCDEVCGGNGVVNGVQEDGVIHGISPSGNFIVRPYFPATDTTGDWQNLADCGPGTRYALTAEDRAYQNSRGEFVNAALPDTVCQYDYTDLYGVIQPNVERFGVSGRVTADLGGGSEGYFQVNFMQSNVDYTGSPGLIYGNAPTGIYYPRFSTSNDAEVYAPGSAILTLPVWVCPERVDCENSANRQLNPNNPFAAQGQVAQIQGRDMERKVYRATRNRAYRAALGVRGNLADNLTYDFAATAMHNDLRRTFRGYVYIQHLLDVIADGTYNFRDPSATPQAVQDYLTPENITDASSDLYQAQLTLGTELAQLPGGPLQLGVGGSVRYEAVDAPSANSDFNGPTERYFTLNAFGTKGDRMVYSAFGEVNAPVLEQVELNLSGRYDRYSSGQDAFSPKIGIKVTPIRQVILRGTYSKGFRIPSFGEANALPTTGYVSNTSSLFNDAFLSQYGCSVDTFATCPTYIRNGSYGLTTLASPDLKPEKSRSFTAGIFVEPVPLVSFSVDYYNIKKTGAITAPAASPALLAYYTGQPIPEGFNVIADAPDPNNPDATPRVAFVESHLVNANTIKVQGLDFGANTEFDIGGVRWNSNLQASLILKLTTTFPDGTVERYDGTLGNFNLTAGSGTPKWHGTWLNTFDLGDVLLSGTVNYFGGYNLSAMDQGNEYKDCGLNDGSVPCDVDAYVTFDANIQFPVDDKFTFYATVLNVFDELPPLDPVTYGAHLYNAVQGGTGILGRYFKAGAKFNF